MRDKFFLKEMSKLELELAEMLKQLSPDELNQYIKDKEEFLEKHINANLPQIAPILPHISAILPLITPVLPHISAILQSTDLKEHDKNLQEEL